MDLGPVPTGIFLPAPGNLNHLNAPRLERPQGLVFPGPVHLVSNNERTGFELVRATAARKASTPIPGGRSISTVRSSNSIQPAVGGAVTVGEAGEMDSGSDLLHEIQGSSRATARSHKETSDQWTELNSHFSPGRWIHYGTTFFFSTLLALF